MSANGEANVGSRSLEQHHERRHIGSSQYIAHVPCARACELLVEPAVGLHGYAVRASSAGGLNTVYNM